jgi:hypothetical protein
VWIRSLLVALGLAVASPAGADTGRVAVLSQGGIAVVADDFASPPVLVVPGAEAPVFSPDGTRLAFLRSGRVEVSAADGSGAVAVTDPGEGHDQDPAWTPDGSALVFRRVAGGQVGLFRVSAGGGPVRRCSGPATRATARRGSWPAGRGCSSNATASCGRRTPTGPRHGGSPSGWAPTS